MPVRTINWFSSFLGSIGRKETAEQVEVTTHHVEETAEALRESEYLPETLPRQQMDNLSNQGCSKPVNGAGTGIEQVEDISCFSLNEKSTSVFIEEVKTDFGMKQDGTTEKISKGDNVAVCIQADRDMHDVVDSAVPGRAHEWDVLKSIIYGGLIESITSLGVVSSAAASDATTLNIVILGLANLMSGLVIILHNIKELKNDFNETTSQENSIIDRYEETLGRRENFRLHAIVAVLSYIIFGLLPPVTYGFSFRKSDDELYKLIMCGAASLVCIILLAIGKAHVRRPPRSYVKTVLYYLLMGLTASGLCYAVGLLIKRLLENSGWFESLSAPSTAFLENRSIRSGWTLTSY
ncbi:membrane protein of ER body-like protein [Telopea speciosissima]|uniref:membrane protein of ER body-like protein n=1 Tax=Telopea speciosissima TaxID=54955 RepID=UPI001CC3E007|nr:membrane protein of ER body-like protein [Telopea speciosissima]